MYSIDLTISGIEELFSKIASSIKTSEFGSQVADVGVVDRSTKEHRSTKLYEALLASSQTAKVRLGELGASSVSGSTINKIFGRSDSDEAQNSIDAAVEISAKGGVSSQPLVSELCEWGNFIVNLSTVSRAAPGAEYDEKLKEAFENCPTLSSTPWYVFAEPLALNKGANSSDALLRWDAVVVFMVRRSNFLASLELFSRTLFPFIAAALVLLIIPTSHTVTRLILRSTKENMKANGMLLKRDAGSDGLGSPTKKESKTMPSVAKTKDGAESSASRSEPTSKRQSYLTRLHSRSGKNHQAFDGTNCKEIFLEIVHRVSRSLRLHRYLTRPLCATVSTAVVVHTLVTSLDNAAWMIAVLFVITGS